MAALEMLESGSMKIVFGHHRVEAVMKPLDTSAVNQGNRKRPPCDQHTPPPL